MPMTLINRLWTYGSSLRLTFATLSIATAGICYAEGELTLLSNFSANQAGGFSAGEIVAFDEVTNRLFVTSSGSNVYRVNIFDLSNPAAPTDFGTVDFSTTFGAPANMLGLSSVAVDPLSRFGVATLIPTDNTGTAGRVGFFNLATGAVIGTANVGFHPVV